jgi:group I intron endonuclease
MTKFYKYNKHAGIYKWQNKINGKCYIGQSIDLGLRLRHHTYKYNHGRYNSPLYKAFEKYGIENFTLEVLYDAGVADISIKPLLNQLEIGYIEKYNAYGITGYNQTRGGDNITISRSEEVKQHNRRTKDTFLYDMQTGWTIKCTSRINAANTIRCDVGFLICCANGMYTRIYNRWLVANSETALVEKINHYRFKK